jgi:hypothetical protein
MNLALFALIAFKTYHHPRPKRFSPGEPLTKHRDEM